ncbi:MAG TPA: DUF6178 family protein [Vicinamibacterales bacterium]|jgi:hypothetical protein
MKKRAPHRRSLSRPAVDQRPLLDRILDSPHVAHVVPRLPPEALHRVIQTSGLEDCTELVALATPAQIDRLFDLDLWRAATPGRDEQFDADRFGTWIEVLAESGASAAAAKLAQLDADVVVAGLAQHCRVLDRAAVAKYMTTDGEEIAGIRDVGDGMTCEIGGYLLVARRSESWDAIVDVIMALDAEHGVAFDRLMSGCREQSDSGRELDGLDNLLADADQAMFDVVVDREQRRDQQGFVSPPQARAFLEEARQCQRDRVFTRGHPLARAYFGAIDEAVPLDASTPPVHLLTGSSEDPADEPPEVAAAVVEVLHAIQEAGVGHPQQPRALLEGANEPAPRLGLFHRCLTVAFERSPDAAVKRNAELAFLANALLAGCSNQGRPFTPREASDAAAAVCNLGLENWSDAAVPDGFLVDHDLLGAFHVGWTMLHEDVVMRAAARLIEVLANLQYGDGETQSAIDALRADLTKHWRAGAPWCVREDLDVIAILDLPSWYALLSLLAEFPVVHAAIAASSGSGPRSVDESAFELISENSQISRIHRFLRSLPDLLGP